MHDVLGPVATALGWTVNGGSYAEAVNSVAVMASKDTIEEITVSKARALADVAVWRRVAAQTSSQYNLDLSGLKMNRESFNRMARNNMLDAEMRAQTDGFLDLGFTIGTYSPRESVGPYENQDITV
jgi:hypothetical protein